jgi:hypothetical protein
MIQRIQSIYLSLILLLSISFFRRSVFNCIDEKGQVIDVLLTGIMTDQSGQVISSITALWPLTLILIIIPLISLVTILTFRNRKIQLILAMWVVIFSSGLIIALAVYAYIMIHSYKLSIVPGIKTAIPVLMFVFSILAYRGILKDHRLVKSYDRLR